MTDGRPGLAVTILGSGGPMASPDRASSGYLVWVDGAPSLLVDAGGGTFGRFGRTGADAAGLEAILLSHTHADHTGELAPIIFSAYLQGRTTPMTILGPAGGAGATGTGRFIDLLFGERGAWRDLRAFEGFRLDVVERPSSGRADLSATMTVAGVTVTTAPVPHGRMPTVAYRIDHAGVSLVIGGDVAHESEELVRLAAGCDLLICDVALPERPVGHDHPHAAPSEVGVMARASGCRMLVLSHLMPEIEADLHETLAHVRRSYDGHVIVADDLMTLRIGGAAAYAGQVGGAQGVPL